MDFTLTLKIGLLAWMLSQPALAQQFPNCNCTGNPQTYCTAGTSVLGCVPAMATSGVPNVLANSGFQLSVANVPAQRYGTIFYGFYSYITPWAPGSPSFKCVASPVQRMGNLFSGGTLGQCNGALGLDFNSWLSSNPTAFGSPFAQGQTIRAQGWYRDPAAPGQTNLSNAVAFTLCGTNTSNICVAPSGFVAIQPGTFQMGESGTATPVHAVTISYQFWMGAKEVTQAEYAALMGSSSSYFGGNTNRPVEQVTWSSARSYCSALTAQQAAQGAVPPGYEYRLPTEAEWEYACRAGTSTSFNIGDFLTCADANMYVNDFCIGQTSPVGSYAPNAWGLYDMHGNVAEWCLDSQTGYPSSAVTDPFGVGAIERAVRGGAWNYGVFGCRSAYRFFSDPSASLSNLGFRLVLGPIRIP